MAQILVQASERSNAVAEVRRGCTLLRAAGIDAWARPHQNNHEGLIEIDDTVWRERDACEVEIVDYH